MNDEPLALFALEAAPDALELEAVAPPAPEPDPAPARRRAPDGPRLTRPRVVVKLRCRAECGWTARRRISRALDDVDELGRCPSCGLVAGVVIVAFLSR